NIIIFFTSRRRHTRSKRDWSSDVCSSDLIYYEADAKKPWTYTWIGFQGIKIKQYLERTSLMDCPVFHYGRDDRIRLCHEKMFERSEERRVGKESRCGWWRGARGKKRCIKR